ncbi:glycosyltransferase family 9 protein [Rhizomicrobium palustre]
MRRKRSVPDPASVRSIAIMVLAAIGDTVIATALIAPLRRRFPNASIIAVTTSANRGIAELSDFDSVVTIPVVQPSKAIKLLRELQLDIAIDCGQWARLSAILTYASKARFTVGFRTEGQARHFAFDAAPPHLATRHELDNFLALIAPLGAETNGRPSLNPPANPPLLTPERQWIAFHPWAAGVRCELREWARERWISLGKALVSRGYDIVITGGPADAVASTELVNAIDPEHARTIAGRSSLRDSLAVLGDVKAVVSVNTGLMHMAAAVGVPLVALHGPTNPLRWGPVSDRAIVLGPGPGGGYLNLGNEYPENPPDTMAEISVEDVENALLRLLASP